MFRIMEDVCLQLLTVGFSCGQSVIECEIATDFQHCILICG